MKKNNYPDLEGCLKAKFGSELRVDKDLAQALYVLFENTTYWHRKTGYEFSCTWRAAGSMIARIRNFKGEDYREFYCGRPENSENYKKAYKILRKCGWRVKPLTLTERWQLKHDIKQNLKNFKQWLSDPEKKDYAEKWIKEFKEHKKLMRFL